MTDLTLHLQFKNLYKNYPQWREQLNFQENNNREWEEFLNVGNAFFLSEFDREFIYHIFPVEKDLLMMRKHFPDLPSRPIHESNLETEISLKTQSCFFDIYLIKKTYATWMENCILAPIDKIFLHNNGEQIYLDLEENLQTLQKSLIGMVYYSVNNDFDKEDTVLNTDIMCGEAKKSQIDAEVALLEIAFILNELEIKLPNHFFDILQQPFMDLAHELNVL